MTDISYLRFLQYLGIDTPGKKYRSGYTGCYVDNRILELVNADVRMLQMQITLDERRIDEATVLSDWGIPLQMIDGYGVRTSHPLSGIDVEKELVSGTLPERIENHDWPDPNDPRRVDGLTDEMKALQNSSDAAIVARSPQSASFIEFGCWLRGDKNFYLDLYLYPELIDILLDKILELQCQYYTALLSAIGDAVDIVETAEDYGTQDSLLISPDHLRRYIFPRRKMLNDHIKKLAPHVKILHHSCGAIATIIGDLFNTGADIINPIQPIEKIMDHAMLKEKYGDRVSFCGGLDMFKAVTGKKEDIESEIVRCVETFGHDGGYMISTSNHIQRDTDPEMVMYLFQRLNELV